VLKTALEIDLLTAALLFQLLCMLFAGMRVSIVSLGYLFFWQATVPILVSRHRRRLLRSKKYYYSQVVVLVWSTLSVATYTIYFIAMAARPDWKDPGAACTFFISSSEIPTNSSSSSSSSRGGSNASISAQYVTPFCVFALERISTGAEVILLLVDLVVGSSTAVIVNQLRSKHAKEAESQRLDQLANEELPESIGSIPLKLRKIHERSNYTESAPTRRNGAARIVFALLMFGIGSLSPTPLSMPSFILAVVELMLWTVDYGSHQRNRSVSAPLRHLPSGASQDRANNFDRSRHIFGSVSPIYWGGVMLYLFLLDVMIYSYNLHGIPPLLWEDGTMMPIGFSIFTVAGAQKNFLQHHFHFLCVLLANACAGMFFTNAWYRAYGRSTNAKETQMSATSTSRNDASTTKAAPATNAASSPNTNFDKDNAKSRISLRTTGAVVGALMRRRNSVASDPGHATHSLCVHVAHLARMWICWFMLLFLTLEHQTVLSFVFFLFLCFALIKHEIIFARGDEGKWGNALLIVWTSGYLFTCYLGSMVMTLGRIPSTNLLNDVGIMQLYGESSAELDRMVDSRRRGAYLPLVLKLPITVLALVVFCAVFKFREHVHHQRFVSKFKKPFFFRSLGYIYWRIGGIRWICLILMFSTTISAPDLIRFPFMLIFVLIMAFPSGLGDSRFIWGFTILYTQALILILFFLEL
jgi:hypothetical protein